MTEILTPTSFAGLQITKAKDKNPWLNLMIYGDSGIGKTTLLGSASVVPEMCPVLMLDFEGGSESLRRSYPDIDIIRIKNYKEVDDVYNELALGRHPYKTALVDSGTEAQKFSMSNILRKMVEERPDLDPDVAGYREWGKSLSQMRLFFRAFRDLEMHTFFTALNMPKKDDRTGLTMNQPSFTGQFINELPAILDVVLYYYVKAVSVEGEDQPQQRRYLLTQKTDTHVAKDRTNSLPMVVEEPTMRKLYDLMIGGPSLTNPPQPEPVIEAQTNDEISLSIPNLLA